MTLKRQFIAGATCPGCGQLDKIQRVNDGDKLWIECVACGMKKDLDDAPTPEPAEQPVKFTP